MIYLKTFENINQGQQNSDYIQQLIDEYMAYLIDDGYGIYSEYHTSRSIKNYSVKIYKGICRPPFTSFDIIDIYDDLLSFIEIMEIKGYVLFNCEVSLIGMKPGDSIEYSKEDVIEQRIDNFQIKYMYLNFDKKSN